MKTNQFEALKLMARTEENLVSLIDTIQKLVQFMAQLEIRVIELEQRITDAGLHLGPVARAWKPEPGEIIMPPGKCEHGVDIDFNCPEGCN